MKRVVGVSPMIWAALCLLGGLVAQETGADSGGIHFAALIVGYFAMACLLMPERMARLLGQSASWRKPQ